MRVRGQVAAPAFGTEIDVYFHVITQGPTLADGDISNATVRRQVDVLTEHLRG